MLEQWREGWEAETFAFTSSRSRTVDRKKIEAQFVRVYIQSGLFDKEIHYMKYHEISRYKPGNHYI